MNDEGWVLNQTMLRIKDPERSVPFYRDVLGMTLARPLRFSADEVLAVLHGLSRCE